MNMNRKEGNIKMIFKEEIKITIDKIGTNVKPEASFQVHGVFPYMRITSKDKTLFERERYTREKGCCHS